MNMLHLKKINRKKLARQKCLLMSPDPVQVLAVVQRTRTVILHVTSGALSARENEEGSGDPHDLQ